LSFTRLWNRFGIPIVVIMIFLLTSFGIYKLLEKPIKNKIPLAVFAEETLLARKLRVPRWLKNWARLERRTPMEKLFAHIGGMLRAWDAPPQSAMTPAEQTAALTVLVPETADSARILLEEYHRAAYSAREADYERARQAAWQLRLAGYKAWWNRFRTTKGGEWPLQRKARS